MKRIIFTIIIVFLCFVKGNSQVTKNKYEEKIYGDFNGDGKFEYAFRVLVKKGHGNPVENGQPDVYEVHFSDKNIKPIKDNFYWFILINEGDLDKDGSDEFSVREDPMNGCIGSVKTFTIKNGKSYYMIEPFSFYSGSCDNDSGINPDDLVENDNGIVYYYDMPDDDLIDSGRFPVNSKGEKIYGKKIKAFEVKPIAKKTDSNNDDALKNILNGTKSKNDNNYHGQGTGREIEENSFGNRKALIKPNPKYNCNEEGTVVVEIVVDKGGNVIDVKSGIKGTTNNSKCLLDACKEAALKSKWEANENAPEKQVGIISYNFSMKE